jgi:hypothetical protein
LSDKQPDGIDAGPAHDVSPPDGPVADAPDAATDTIAEVTSFPMKPPGRAVSEWQAIRTALKARIAGVRAHLTHACNGDHRATVAALTALTDLVRDMFGPDNPEDSLRGALADLAAGRTDDARTALDAARTVLARRQGSVGAAGQEAAEGAISAALLALAIGDRSACTDLIETALDHVESAD